MQPEKRRRRFYLITIGIFIAIISAVVVIVVYTDFSYASVAVSGPSSVSFVLAYDSTNLTLSAGQNATVAVLPGANVTLTASPVSPFIVSGWTVSGANYHAVGQDTINFVAGGGGNTVRVSVQLRNGSAAG